LSERIDQHLGWLDDEPGSDAANHWKGEIKGWLQQIKDVMKDMGKRTGREWDKYVKEVTDKIEQMNK